MQNQNQVIVYHKDDQGYNLYFNPVTKKVIKAKTLPLGNNNFFVLKGDYQNEAGEIDAKSLVKFYKDFKRWCDELLMCNIEYTKYHSHFDAVKINFNRWAGVNNKNLIQNMC